MFQGTGSSVGKSTLVAGLARAFTRRGLKVLPFKPQNMSNNAAVTANGGEIGRAQALQARACGVLPHVDMNPVLLKPQGETGAQLVVQGHKLETVAARSYQTRKKALMPAVLESFYNLTQKADLVLVEGAGSASEVNLRAYDIANMGFAQAVQAPVIMVGDIDRGGVIASLVGTKVVVAETDAALIHGFIVNKMRGDISLFDGGMAFIANRTGWQPLGLVPDLPAVRTLPAEDAADLLANLRQAPLTAPYSAPPATQSGPLRATQVKPPSPQPLRIAVPLLPLIANFDDLDPLRVEPGVVLLPVLCGQRLPECDLVLLPGSKNTMADLKTLRENGWESDLHAHVARGGHVMGICGGYQMLGQSIADPYGTEGPACTTQGLGLLEIETILSAEKYLFEKEGFVKQPQPQPQPQPQVMGYEMHIGRTTGVGCKHPLLELAGQPEGAVSTNGQVYGSYLHGIFGSRAARMALLARAGGQAFAPGGNWYEAGRTANLPAHHNDVVENALNALADHLERFIDLDALLALAQVPQFLEKE
ncbi:cobalamin biosynthesis protein CobQ [Acetobacter orientalis]|uniref:cobyric acid synthase n=1 Tax=Acetobacter orientalis TaxID=146474 RepID=UPI000A3AAA86|nr:cobyric acid synthase [Acetobacter orientalis]OUJ16218.1 cobalamin biosynthesis protein CobQ [Acetobacter orientalis]